MTERDDLLRRVAGVDPYPSDQPLPSDISDARPPVAILIQGGDDVDRVSPLERARTTRWWRGPAVAVAALVVALLVAIPFLLIDGSDDPVANTTPAPVSTTVPTTPDEPANAMLVTPEIGATWTLVATVDDWLIEPSLVDGELFAIRRGLDSNAEPNSEGILEGMVVGFGGEDDGSPPDYWRSVDGAVWTRTDNGGPPPPPSGDAAVAGASVSVERVISEGEGGTRVDNVVMATSSGASPRAINLRPFQNDWMPRVMMGDLGWVVYSPALEVGLAGNGSQGPRVGNLGLWYSPDTESWFEVTDRGPLVDTFGDVGPIDVFDEGIVVRDDDILVFAATAEDVGWGIVSQLETEIWRLELSVDPTPAAQESTPSTTSPVAADDGAAPPDESTAMGWDPMLSTTNAKAAPPAAMCPDSTDPDLPGPIDQARPGEGPWNNQAAVFDTRQGRIVYLDEAGETWTFDVCTNTWHAMNPTGAPYGDWRVSREFGELVYDIDSDRTIAFGPYFVSVYNANTNTWTQQSETPSNESAFGWPGLGAVYDSLSGLVIVQTGEGLVAYDVDTDTWTSLGQLSCSPHMVYDADSDQWSPAEPVPGCTPFLIGHSTGSDQLVFLGFQDGGLLVDPRAGASTYLEAPPGGVMGGFGSFRYATSGDTAYTYGETVCRLDPITFGWDCAPRGDPGSMPGAMVYDPINTRIVVINNFCCTWPGSSVSDDVWAIDMDTGERTELLAAANTRTETDGSQ